MNYIKKTYIRYLFFNKASSKDDIQEVKTRDLEKVEIPESAFAFSFFDVVSIVVDVDGSKIELKSKEMNISPLYYYGGQLYNNWAEIPFFSILFMDTSLSYNLRVFRKKEDKIIHCRTGNWELFETKSCVLLN